ncbi:MAG: hypothetical protein KGS72_11820 [Cyanobacteria bacterium REEB67]|nr:hypothetical protein [Cyanobacteria bacterium REEB67]
MTQRKAAQPKNEPIVLSGSVFLDGILAEDIPRARMPARLNVGDIRLHNVNKPGERPRFGEKVTFSGFIVAGIWDGKKFRRLLLRKLGAVESTYVGPVARRERSMVVLRYLSTLVRRQAVWFAEDSGYEVTRTVVTTSSAPAADVAPVVASVKAEEPAPLSTVASAPTTPATPPVPSTASVAVSVTVKVKVQVDGQPVVRTTTETQHLAARKRRRRSQAADKDQLPLFPDQV